jgi:HK97 family phage prohead protease
MDVLDFQFKIAELDVSRGVFKGYASTFGNLDLQGDVVRPGAFARTLKERGAEPIPILWSHDTHQPIGAGTEAREDSHGLAVTGELILSVARAAEVRDLMRAGIVKGLSIGYSVPAGGAKQAADGHTRELVDIDLMEFSPCVIPANPRARITAPPKSLAAMTPAEWSAHFREAGFSRRETDRLVYAVRGLGDPAEDAAIADLTAWLQKQRKGN